jgi:heat shock protein 1/8
LGSNFLDFIIFANFRLSSAANSYIRTFTTVADQQSTVQFPVFQGERVNCEDNTSLGEFTLAPIPPMRAGEAVLEVVFEVDVNGILKVTATEKTSGRSANITISNSVGKLSSYEIENMISGKSSHCPPHLNMY